MKKHELLEKAMRDYPKDSVIFWEVKENNFKTNVPYKIHQDDNCIKVVDSNGMDLYDSRWSSNDGWAEIITEKPALDFNFEIKQPSILDDKVAIQVNNEREFKLLMEHYENKGFKSHATHKIFLDTYNITSSFSEVPTAVSYCEYFGHSKLSYWKENEWKIILFTEFAKEVGITPPLFIMKSEDGVDLYEGDKFWIAEKVSDKWYLDRHYDGGDEHEFKFSSNYKTAQVVAKPEYNKPFSTREAAEKWIEEQNKPKEIVIGYSEVDPYATVYKDQVHFTRKSDLVIYEFTGEEIEQIYKAYQSLQ